MWNGFVGWKKKHSHYNIYFSRLTCAPQYHSTSDAPCTPKIASCEAKLPQNTHLLRLSFWRLPTSGTGNSLTDIKVFSIHSLSITASAIYSWSPVHSSFESFWYSLLYSCSSWLALDASYKGNPSNNYHKNTLLLYAWVFWVLIDTSCTLYWMLWRRLIEPYKAKTTPQPLQIRIFFAMLTECGCLLKYTCQCLNRSVLFNNILWFLDGVYLGCIISPCRGIAQLGIRRVTIY